MKVRSAVLVSAAMALALAATVSWSRHDPMWIGDCWGTGLKSKAGRALLERSNINCVELLARVEYLEGDIQRALANPRHRPWPWLDPTYRESLDSLIRKAAGLGLKVQLNLDPGGTAVSPAFRRRLRAGAATPDEGSAWLFPKAKSGYSDRQIALYADLFARTAAQCEKAYPGVVKWIQVGNDLGFPADNYRRLVEAVVEAVKARGLGVAVVADGLGGRLPREMPNGKLPDIVGFHHLPAFAAEDSKYPSQAELVLELRRALGGKRSYRGRSVEIWVDEWNPVRRGESLRDAAAWRGVVDLLDEQRRLGVTGSIFITFCLDGERKDRAAAWALGFSGGAASPGFNDIAAKVGQLTGVTQTEHGRPRP
jgi:hypothetical protein